MPPEETPDCLSCGCCCFSQLADYVRVTGDDFARLGEQAERWVQFDGNRAYMRMEDGHCAALQVVAVRDASGHPTSQFVCSVYEQRPETCRALARDSAECRAERHEKRQRPSLLVLRLARS
jgi:uncharacterized protein